MLKLEGGHRTRHCHSTPEGAGQCAQGHSASTDTVHISTTQLKALLERTCTYCMVDLQHLIHTWLASATRHRPTIHTVNTTARHIARTLLLKALTITRSQQDGRLLQAKALARWSARANHSNLHDSAAQHNNKQSAALDDAPAGHTSSNISYLADTPLHSTAVAAPTQSKQNNETQGNAANINTGEHSKLPYNNQLLSLATAVHKLLLDKAVNQWRLQLTTVHNNELPLPIAVNPILAQHGTTAPNPVTPTCAQQDCHKSCWPGHTYCSKTCARTATARTKDAQVIILKKSKDGYSFLAQRRSTNMYYKPGCMSAVGGAKDPTDATSRDTAVRELQEETGLCTPNLIDRLVNFHDDLRTDWYALVIDDNDVWETHAASADECDSVDDWIKWLNPDLEHYTSFVPFGHAWVSLSRLQHLMTPSAADSPICWWPDILRLVQDAIHAVGALEEPSPSTSSKLTFTEEPSAFAVAPSAAAGKRDIVHKERSDQIKKQFKEATLDHTPGMISLKGGGLNINNLMSAVQGTNLEKQAALIQTLIDGDYDEFVIIETHMQCPEHMETLRVFLHQHVVPQVLRRKGHKDWQAYPIDGPEMYAVFGSYYQSTRPLRRGGTVIIVKQKYRVSGWGGLGCRGELTAKPDVQGRFAAIKYEDFNCVLMGSYPRNTSDHPNPYILREHYSLTAGIAAYVERSPCDVLLLTDSNSSSSWEAPEVYRHPRQCDPAGVSQSKLIQQDMQRLGRPSGVAGMRPLTEGSNNDTLLYGEGALNTPCHDILKQMGNAVGTTLVKAAFLKDIDKRDRHLIYSVRMDKLLFFGQQPKVRMANTMGVDGFANDKYMKLYANGSDHTRFEWVREVSTATAESNKTISYQSIPERLSNIGMDGFEDTKTAWYNRIEAILGKKHATDDIWASYVEAWAVGDTPPLTEEEKQHVKNYSIAKAAHVLAQHKVDTSTQQPAQAALVASVIDDLRTLHKVCGSPQSADAAWERAKEIAAQASKIVEATLAKEGWSGILGSLKQMRREETEPSQIILRIAENCYPHDSKFTTQQLRDLMVCELRLKHMSWTSFSSALQKYELNDQVMKVGPHHDEVSQQLLRLRIGYTPTRWYLRPATAKGLCNLTAFLEQVQGVSPSTAKHRTMQQRAHDLVCSTGHAQRALTAFYMNAYYVGHHHKRDAYYVNPLLQAERLRTKANQFKVLVDKNRPETTNKWAMITHSAQAANWINVVAAANQVALDLESYNTIRGHLTKWVPSKTPPNSGPQGTRRYIATLTKNAVEQLCRLQATAQESNPADNMELADLTSIPGYLYTVNGTYVQLQVRQRMPSQNLRPPAINNMDTPDTSTSIHPIERPLDKRDKINKVPADKEDAVPTPSTIYVDCTGSELLDHDVIKGPTGQPPGTVRDALNHFAIHTVPWTSSDSKQLPQGRTRNLVRQYITWQHKAVPALAHPEQSLARKWLRLRNLTALTLLFSREQTYESKEAHSDKTTAMNNDLTAADQAIWSLIGTRNNEDALLGGDQWTLAQGVVNGPDTQITLTRNYTRYSLVWCLGDQEEVAKKLQQVLQQLSTYARRRSSTIVSNNKTYCRIDHICDPEPLRTQVNQVLVRQSIQKEFELTIPHSLKAYQRINRLAGHTCPEASQRRGEHTSQWQPHPPDVDWAGFSNLLSSSLQKAMTAWKYLCTLSAQDLAEVCEIDQAKATNLISRLKYATRTLQLARQPHSHKRRPGVCDRYIRTLPTQAHQWASYGQQVLRNTLISTHAQQIRQAASHCATVQEGNRQPIYDHLTERCSRLMRAALALQLDDEDCNNPPLLDQVMAQNWPTIQTTIQQMAQQHNLHLIETPSVEETMDPDAIEMYKKRASHSASYIWQHSHPAPHRVNNFLQDIQKWALAAQVTYAALPQEIPVQTVIPPTWAPDAIQGGALDSHWTAFMANLGCHPDDNTFQQACNSVTNNVCTLYQITGDNRKTIEEMVGMHMQQKAIWVSIWLGSTTFGDPRGTYIRALLDGGCSLIAISTDTYDNLKPLGVESYLPEGYALAPATCANASTIQQQGLIDFSIIWPNLEYATNPQAPTRARDLHTGWIYKDLAAPALLGVPLWLSRLRNMRLQSSQRGEGTVEVAIQTPPKSCDSNNQRTPEQGTAIPVTVRTHVEDGWLPMEMKLGLASREVVCDTPVYADIAEPEPGPPGEARYAMKMPDMEEPWRTAGSVITTMILDARLPPHYHGKQVLIKPLLGPYYHKLIATEQTRQQPGRPFVTHQSLAKIELIGGVAHVPVQIQWLIEGGGDIEAGCPLARVYLYEGNSETEQPVHWSNAHLNSLENHSMLSAATVLPLATETGTMVASACKELGIQNRPLSELPSSQQLGVQLQRATELGSYWLHNDLLDAAAPGKELSLLLTHIVQCVKAYPHATLAFLQHPKWDTSLRNLTTEAQHLATQAAAKELLALRQEAQAESEEEAKQCIMSLTAGTDAKHNDTTRTLIPPSNWETLVMRLKGPDHEYAVIIICGQQALTIEREGHLMLPSATCGKKVKPKEAAEEAIRAAAAITSDTWYKCTEHIQSRGKIETYNKTFFIHTISVDVTKDSLSPEARWISIDKAIDQPFSDPQDLQAITKSIDSTQVPILKIIGRYQHVPITSKTASKFLQTYVEDTYEGPRDDSQIQENSDDLVPAAGPVLTADLTADVLPKKMPEAWWEPTQDDVYYQQWQNHLKPPEEGGIGEQGIRHIRSMTHGEQNNIIRPRPNESKDEAKKRSHLEKKIVHMWIEGVIIPNLSTFNPDPNDPPIVKGVLMDEPYVTLTCKAAIDSPPKKLSEIQMQAAVEQTEELIRKGLCSRGVSAWNHHILMVPKASGGLRLCLDLRRLNSHTIRINYPMPQAYQMAERAARHSILYSMDALSGFHQIRLKASLQSKFSWSIMNDGIIPHVSQMGATNSMALFLWAMQKALHCLNTGCCDLSQHNSHVQEAQGTDANTSHAPQQPCQASWRQQIPPPTVLKDVLQEGQDYQEEEGIIWPEDAIRFPTPAEWDLVLMPGRLIKAEDTSHQGSSGAYVDDCLGAFTPSMSLNTDFQKMLESMRCANVQIKCLRVYNIHISSKKCKFMHRQLSFLGWLIGRGYIRAQDEKIERLRNWKRPGSVQEILSALGGLNFYRRLLPQTSHKEHLLIELTKKGQTWNWRRDTENAWKSLMQGLTSANILHPFQEGRRTIVTTDASAWGMGAVLSQEDPTTGEERLCLVAATTFVEGATKWSATEREMTAIVWATTEVFQEYLQNKTYLLISDHASIKWIFKSGSTNDRLERWSILLQAQDCQVSIRKGRHIPMPDFASRCGIAHAREDMREKDGTKCITGRTVGGAKEEHHTDHLPGADKNLGAMERLSFRKGPKDSAEPLQDLDYTMTTSRRQLVRFLLDKLHEKHVAMQAEKDAYEHVIQQDKPGATVEERIEEHMLYQIGGLENLLQLVLEPAAYELIKSQQGFEKLSIIDYPEKGEYITKLVMYEDPAQEVHMQDLFKEATGEPAKKKRHLPMVSNLEVISEPPPSIIGSPGSSLLEPAGEQPPQLVTEGPGINMQQPNRYSQGRDCDSQEGTKSKAAILTGRYTPDKEKNTALIHAPYIGDQFAGCGGLSSGFKKSHIMMTVEQSYFPAQELLHRYGRLPIADIEDTRPQHYLGFFAITSASPCQPWSTAGRQLGYGDTAKSSLWMTQIEAPIKAGIPFMLLENVSTLADSFKHPTLGLVSPLTLLKQQFEQKGYVVRHKIMSAAEVGGATTRVRLIVQAMRQELYDHLQERDQDGNSRLRRLMEERLGTKYYAHEGMIWPKRQPITTAQHICNFMVPWDEVPSAYKLPREMYRKFRNDIKYYQHAWKVCERGSNGDMGVWFDNNSIWWDQGLAPCFTAMGSTRYILSLVQQQGCLIPRIRRLMPSEVARATGFVKDLALICTRTPETYSMVGNAVDTHLSAALARPIEEVYYNHEWMTEYVKKQVHTDVWRAPADPLIQAPPKQARPYETDVNTRYQLQLIERLTNEENKLDWADRNKLFQDQLDIATSIVAEYLGVPTCSPVATINTVGTDSDKCYNIVQPSTTNSSPGGGKKHKQLGTAIARDAYGTWQALGHMIGSSAKETVQKMVEKQREDMPYRVMMDYCDSGKIPDDELEREVIRTTDKYVTIEGVLYKINEAGSKDSHEMDLLLCVPHSLRSTLIKLYHVAMGHCSDEICIASLRTRYYWPKLATEVKQVLKGCLACEKYKDVKPARARAYETQLVMEGFPGSELIIDFLGPFGNAAKVAHPRGFTCGCVLQDGFSRYGWFYASKSPSAEAAAEAIMDFGLRNGFPEKITSDRGSAFTSDVLHELTRVLGVQHSVSASGRAESHGKVERLNAFVTSRIATILMGNYKDWDKAAAYVLHGHNISPKQALGGHCPHFLFFGRRPSFYADVGMPTKKQKASLQTYVDQIIPQIKLIIDAVRTDTMAYKCEVLRKDRQRMGQFKTAATEYKEGDRVKIYIPVVSKGDGLPSKLKGRYILNYEIVSKCGKCTYYVRRKASENKAAVPVHASRIKAYVGDDDLTGMAPWWQIQEEGAAIPSHIVEDIMNDKESYDSKLTKANVTNIRKRLESPLEITDRVWWKQLEDAQKNGLPILTKEDVPLSIHEDSPQQREPAPQKEAVKEHATLKGSEDVEPSREAFHGEWSQHLTEDEEHDEEPDSNCIPAIELKKDSSIKQVAEMLTKHEGTHTIPPGASTKEKKELRKQQALHISELASEITSVNKQLFRSAITANSRIKKGYRLAVPGHATHPDINLTPEEEVGDSQEWLQNLWEIEEITDKELRHDGIHYLVKFAPTGGVSVTQWIREQDLSQATSLIDDWTNKTNQVINFHSKLPKKTKLWPPKKPQINILQAPVLQRLQWTPPVIDLRPHEQSLTAPQVYDLRRLITESQAWGLILGQVPRVSGQVIELLLNKLPNDIHVVAVNKWGNNRQLARRVHQQCSNNQLRYPMPDSRQEQACQLALHNLRSIDESSVYRFLKAMAPNQAILLRKQQAIAESIQPDIPRDICGDNGPSQLFATPEEALQHAKYRMHLQLLPWTKVCNTPTQDLQQLEQTQASKLHKGHQNTLSKQLQTLQQAFNGTGHIPHAQLNHCIATMLRQQREDTLRHPYIRTFSMPCLNLVTIVPKPLCIVIIHIDWRGEKQVLQTEDTIQLGEHWRQGITTQEGRSTEEHETRLKKEALVALKKIARRGTKLSQLEQQMDIMRNQKGSPILIDLESTRYIVIQTLQEHPIAAMLCDGRTGTHWISLAEQAREGETDLLRRLRESLQQAPTIQAMQAGEQEQEEPTSFSLNIQDAKAYASKHSHKGPLFAKTYYEEYAIQWIGLAALEAASNLKKSQHQMCDAQVKFMLSTDGKTTANVRIPHKELLKLKTLPAERCELRIKHPDNAFENIGTINQYREGNGSSDPDIMEGELGMPYNQLEENGITAGTYKVAVFSRPVAFLRQSAAIMALGPDGKCSKTNASKEQAASLRQLLLQGVPTSTHMQDNRMQPPDYSSYLSTLDDSQKQAVEIATNRQAHPMVLIQGPPGGGKTTCLVAITLCWVDYLRKKLQQTGQQSKVLITFPTNITADDMIKKLCDRQIRQVPLKIVWVIARTAIGVSSEKAKPYLLDNIIENEKEENERGGYRFSTSTQADQRRLGRLVQRKKEQPELMSTEELLDMNILRKRIKKEVFRQAEIIIATTTMSGHKELREDVDNVEVWLADEAAQSIEPEMLIPLSFLPQKSILVGDHKQMPPHWECRADAQFGITSFFERLMDMERDGQPCIPRVRLQIHYRGPLRLIHVNNCRYYGEEITTTSEHEESIRADNELMQLEWKNPNLPLHWVETRGEVVSNIKDGDPSPSNMAEVTATVAIISNLRKKKILDKDIRVITYYSKQARVLRSQLPGISVNTTETSQGREGKYVILSLVKQKSTDFLRSEGRFNVATSRATHGVFIIGSSEVAHAVKLKGIPQDNPWQAYFEYCEQNKVVVYKDEAAAEPAQVNQLTTEQPWRNLLSLWGTHTQGRIQHNMWDSLRQSCMQELEKDPQLPDKEGHGIEQALAKTMLIAAAKKDRSLQPDWTYPTILGALMQIHRSPGTKTVTSLLGGHKARLRLTIETILTQEAAQAQQIGELLYAGVMAVFTEQNTMRQCLTRWHSPRRWASLVHKIYALARLIVTKWFGFMAHGKAWRAIQTGSHLTVWQKSRLGRMLSDSSNGMGATWPWGYRVYIPLPPECHYGGDGLLASYFIFDQEHKAHEQYGLLATQDWSEHYSQLSRTKQKLHQNTGATPQVHLRNLITGTRLRRIVKAFAITMTWDMQGRAAWLGVDVTEPLVPTELGWSIVLRAILEAAVDRQPPGLFKNEKELSLASDVLKGQIINMITSGEFRPHSREITLKTEAQEKMKDVTVSMHALTTEKMQNEELWFAIEEGAVTGLNKKRRKIVRMLEQHQQQYSASKIQLQAGSHLARAINKLYRNENPAEHPSLPPWQLVRRQVQLTVEESTALVHSMQEHGITTNNWIIDTCDGHRPVRHPRLDPDMPFNKGQHGTSMGVDHITGEKRKKKK